MCKGQHKLENVEGEWLSRNDHGSGEGGTLGETAKRYQCVSELNFNIYEDPRKRLHQQGVYSCGRGRRSRLWHMRATRTRRCHVDAGRTIERLTQADGERGLLKHVVLRKESGAREWLADESVVAVAGGRRRSEVQGESRRGASDTAVGDIACGQNQNPPKLGRPGFLLMTSPRHLTRTAGRYDDLGAARPSPSYGVTTA